MREIKFKAFDKIDNRIAGVRQIEFKQNGDIDFFVIIKPKVINKQGDLYYEFPKRQPNEFELLEYTGLKDKKGNEIYEGDIIKSGFGEKVIVEYIEKIASFRLITNHTQTKENFELSKSWANDVKVIGNKYENPELIE